MSKTHKLREEAMRSKREAKDSTGGLGQIGRREFLKRVGPSAAALALSYSFTG
jgi:hypothetical protein